MKMRNPNNKASNKVYPSSTTAATAATTAGAGDSLSVLNLLPAAILSLAVVLSVEDREVLAYMITRSVKSATSSSSSATDYKKRSSSSHKSPVFDCDCFDCYTNYWFKWDTSPNRELIHQAIEAFEETLAGTEQCRRKKRKEKSGRRDKTTRVSHSDPQNDVALAEPEPEAKPELAESSQSQSQSKLTETETETVTETVTGTAREESRGLTRKVLPDVIGLFNWRLWSLWSPSDNNNFF